MVPENLLLRNRVEIKEYLKSKKDQVEEALHRFFPAPVQPFTEHIEAMHYSLFAGGKRIRPILCIAAAEAVGADHDRVAQLLPYACALECIHTYSLVHDDLPAMDDDELRRGKPTNHVLYGEAAAILAGDGLLTYAFELASMKSTTLTADQQLKMVSILAKAAGSFGMVGGQALDIAHENSNFPFEMLQTIHRNKTGSLITASLHIGAIGGGARGDQLEGLLLYGERIGLAFQIVDDLLNVTSTTEQLGKQAGSDATRGKATYPAHFGVEETRQRAVKAVNEAREAISSFGREADPLHALAEYIRTRSH